MDKILFGKDRAIVDDYQVFADQEGLEAHEYDTQCIDTLLHEMETAEEGHLFLVFLEGTHFDYSWPAHLSLPLMPPSDGIDYLQITYSKTGLEGIKNRYRHAIYHIDHQFNRFLQGLKSHPQEREAVVVLTSDHGEEFYEEGRLFHASNLNSVQTRIPLYYRLGISSPTVGLTSHVDIFPTLIDHVFGEIGVADWFDGESLLRPHQKHFAISARYNASRTPYEFLITTDREELLARFENRSNISRSKTLQILHRKDRQGASLATSTNEIERIYQPIFDQLFPRGIGN